ncbi:MAG: RNA-binding protein [Planctomycetota bacterium]
MRIGRRAHAPTRVMRRKVTVISVYVGNLPYDTSEEQIVELFKQFGEVNRAALVKDRETGRPRGFGFVEMPNDDEARKAIEALAGKDYEGRPLTVNEARNRSAQRNSANLSRSAHKDEQPEEAAPSDEIQAEDNGGGYSNDMGKS